MEKMVGKNKNCVQKKKKKSFNQEEELVHGSSSMNIEGKSFSFYEKL